MPLNAWKSSLVGRLVLYFLILSQLTVALLGTIAVFQARQALERSILDRLQVAADLKTESLSQWVDDQLDELLLLAETRAFREPAQRLLAREAESPDEASSPAPELPVLREMTAGISARRSEWAEIALLSPKSRIAFSTVEAHEGDHRILDRYFTEGRRRTFVQQVYPSPVTFRPTMTLATPIPLPDETNGVLAVHLNLERMDAILLESTGLGAGSESYLVDSFNVFLSGQRFGREGFSRGVRSQGIGRALAQENGSGRYLNYRDVQVLGVYRWVDSLGAALLTEMPQEQAFAPARRLAYLIGAAGLLIALVLTLATLIVARQIARPVLRIADAAQRVANGDLKARAPVMTADETGVLARTFNDMTSRLETLYDETESRAAELERFTYTVSHDLKGPLFTIRGFIGMLARDAKRGDEAAVRRDISRIEAAVDHMRQLLDELLELSRVGRVANPSETVPLDDVVADAREILAGPISESAAEIRVAELLPVAFGDRLRLREVFQNLISNAIKFTRNPPPMVEIGAEQRGAEILCWVRDQGSGIDPRYHEKIFGLFERLDHTIEGTGVGLPLVRRIIEVHGGTIWVESEIGTGATFYFTLPRCPAKPPLRSLE